LKRSLFLLFLFSGSVLLAQAPPQMPKPSPELKRLGYFLGRWNIEGEMKPGPMGPGGKFTGTETDEWFPGRFFVISHSSMKSPMGEIRGLSVLGYDPEKKVYTYNGFNSMGEREKATGTVTGDTWTYTDESEYQGKPMKIRVLLKELSATSYTFKFDVAMGGEDFQNMMEATATKAAPPPPAKK